MTGSPDRKALLPSWLALSAVAIAVALTWAPACAALGDANRDGKLDVIDVQHAAKLIVHEQAERWPGEADADGSGTLDVVDVQLIVNAILEVPGPLVYLGPAFVHGIETSRHNSIWLPSAGGSGTRAWSSSGALPPGMVLSADGFMTGTPLVTGAFPVQLRLSDQAAGEVMLALTVHVSPPFVNRYPVATPDALLAKPGIPLAVGARGLLENDWDPDGHALVAKLVTQPSQGTVALSGDGSLVLTMGSGASGTDSFLYRCWDGFGGFSLGQVSITVVSNLPPVAADDDYTAALVTPLTISAPGLLGNDTEPESETLSAFLHSQALHGTAVVHTSGAFSYTAMPGFEGVDEFVYAVTDAHANVSFGTVRILVYAGPVPEPTLESVAPPGPVPTASAFLAEARFWDPAGILAPFPNAARIQVTGFGLAQPLPMVYSRHSSPGVAVYRAWVPTSGLLFGVHEGLVACQYSPGVTFEAHLSVAVYTGQTVHVGPSRSHSTFALGLAAAMPGSVVQIDPGVYTGLGNTGLTVPAHVMLAGRLGLHHTTVAAGTGFISGFAGPGSFVCGLTVQNGTASAIRINASTTVYRVRLRSNVISSSVATEPRGAAIHATAQGFQVRECWFRGNHVVSGSVATHGGSMWAFNPVGALIQRCVFWLDESSSAVEGNGGSVCGVGTTGNGSPGAPLPASPMVIDRCLFSECEAKSTSAANGGAVSVHSGCWVDVTRSRFVLCAAIATGYTASEFPAPIGIAHGGGVFAAIDGRVRVSASHFSNCLAKGHIGGWGGGAAARMSSVIAVHGVTFTECEAFTIEVTMGKLDSGGGGCFLGQNSVGTFESSEFLACTATGGDWVYGLGGGLHAGDSCGAQLVQCVIDGCSADSGWGVFGTGCWLMMVHCRVLNCEMLPATSPTIVPPLAYYVGNFPNHARHAAIYVKGGMSCVLEHCDIRLNHRAGFWHEPMASAAPNLTRRMSNCLVVQNTGSGVVMDKASANPAPVSPATVEFTTIALNGGGNDGGLVARYTLVNSSIVRDNGPVNINDGENTNTALRCCVMPFDPLWARNPAGFNLTVDPQFAPGLPGAWCLGPLSPCIDHGGAPAAGVSLAGLTALASGLPGTGAPDLGYHYATLLQTTLPPASVTLAQLIQQDAPGVLGGSMPLPLPMLIVP